MAITGSGVIENGPGIGDNTVHSQQTGFFWQKPLLIACFLLLCVLVQFVIRIDYGPDEPYHVEYIHVLATTHQIPDRADTYEVHHAVPYYALMAVIWKLAGVTQRPLEITPGAKALAQLAPNAIFARRLVRFASSLIAACTLLILFKILEALGLSRRAQIYIVCLMAGIPMFQYLSGLVNNDNLSILYSAIVCLAVTRRVMARDCTIKDAIILGLLTGGCTLVKQGALFAAPIALWAVWTLGASTARVRRVLVFAAAMVLIGIWWPLHIHIISGQWFPDFLSPAEQGKQRAYALSNPLIILSWAWTILLTSVLPDWSWSFLPPTLSAGIVAVTLCVMAALFVVGLRSRAKSPSRQLQILALCALALLLAGVLQFSLQHDYKDQLGGRFLLNGIAWLALFFGASFRLLKETKPVVFAKLTDGSTASRACLALPPAILLCIVASWWYFAWVFYQNMANT